MTQRVQALGLETSVKFLGFRNDVHDVLRMVDVVTMPSLEEGLPIALLEAMACGRPVVATPVGGIPVGQLVEVRETRAPIEVVRVDQRPVSIVEATVERGGTARAERDVGRALAGLEVPAGLTWRISGADAERRRTSSELGLVALLSVALVFLVLAGEFASFTTPLVVMLTVPLAGTGSLLALWLTGQSLNAAIADPLAKYFRMRRRRTGGPA